MVNIDELKFDEKGLIPAIVVDAVTKQVMICFLISKEALKAQKWDETKVYFHSF